MLAFRMKYCSDHSRSFSTWFMTNAAIYLKMKSYMEIFRMVNLLEYHLCFFLILTLTCSGSGIRRFTVTIVVAEYIVYQPGL